MGRGTLDQNILNPIQNPILDFTNASKSGKKERATAESEVLELNNLRTKIKNFKVLTKNLKQRLQKTQQ